MIFKHRLIFYFIAGIAVCTAQAGSPRDSASLFGPFSAVQFLTGDFNARTHPDFVELRNLRQADSKRVLHMHKDAAAALIRMEQAFRQRYPDIPFIVASTTRDYSYQRRIWDRKWNAAADITDTRKRLFRILEFSAMPGTSRHHWGTEFDLWPLENKYYNKGQGLALYNWMNRNAPSYGFCQPYSAGRNTGHNEERWHWSFKPLASIFSREWKKLFATNSIKKTLAVTYIYRFHDTALLYQASVNTDCL